MSGFVLADGRDLDALFSSTYSNAGGLAFKQSDGWDLGNKYSPGSLGYNVNFKISNGTDLGVVRGNKVVPDASYSNAWILNRYVDNHRYTSTSGAGEDASTWYSGSFYGDVHVEATFPFIPNVGLNWQLCVCHFHTENGYTHNYNAKFWDGTGNHYRQTPTICSTASSLAPNVESPWVTIYNGGTSTNPSRNLSYGIEANDGRCSHKVYQMYIRVYHRVYNGNGSSPWYHHDLNIQLNNG